MTSTTHPRLAPRRGSSAGTWWSKAMLRAVEEAAYHLTDLRKGRSLARSGAVGAITVSPGHAVAAVTEGDDAFTVEVSVPVLVAEDLSALTELVATESGHVAALLTGVLPHQLVEALEEAGVELLPYGGELGSACTCEAWPDPCPHALAVLTQLAWLVQADPFVITHLRGAPRDDVLRDLHRLTTTRGADTDAGAATRPGSVEGGCTDEPDDFAVAEEAAARAARTVDQLLAGQSPEGL